MARNDICKQSPYAIPDLQSEEGSSYSKRRFYELVKLYHPDRHNHDISTYGLSYATKLEKNRLVVAANEILSDPVKGSAYDCYGAGWNAAPDIITPRDPSIQQLPGEPIVVEDGEVDLADLAIIQPGITWESGISETQRDHKSHDLFRKVLSLA